MALRWVLLGSLIPGTVEADPGPTPPVAAPAVQGEEDAGDPADTSTPSESEDTAPPDAPPHLALEAQGRAIFLSLGCESCHSLSGHRLIGPPLDGWAGAAVERADGTCEEMGEEQFRRALLDPQAEIAPGYPDAMPAYRGFVDEAQLALLWSLMVSLSPEHFQDCEGPDEGAP